MNTFKLLPRKWYSSDYRILRGGTEITCLKFLSGPERSQFILDGTVYLARKERWDSSNFFLTSSQTQLARAEKPRWFSQTISVEYGSDVYRLQSHSNRFALSRQGREVGSIAKQGWFTKKAVAELPEELPLPASIFVIWLVLLMWKRNDDSAVVVAG
jgi:hypothetical protein